MKLWCVAPLVVWLVWADAVTGPMLAGRAVNPFTGEERALTGEVGPAVVLSDGTTSVYVRSRQGYWGRTYEWSVDQETWRPMAP